MSDYTLRHIAAANVEEPAPVWPAPEPIRQRLTVMRVIQSMIASGELTPLETSRALFLGCQGGTIPPIFEEYEWWEFCVSRLRCKLDRGEFRADGFWMRFCRTAEHLLGEC